jgi:hypothetical protein
MRSNGCVRELAGRSFLIAARMRFRRKTGDADTPVVLSMGFCRMRESVAKNVQKKSPDCEALSLQELSAASAQSPMDDRK